MKITNILLISTAGLITSIAHATDVSFAHGGEFDGDVASDTAIFADATITTLSFGGTATELNENLGYLAAVGGSSNTRWDQGESWTFEFNKDINFDIIGFGVFTGSDDEATLQSSDWIGAGFVESDAELAFDDTTGTFTFSGGNNRDFDLSVIVTGGVSVSALSDITFTNSGSGGNFEIERFSFSVVPEPGTFALLSGFCGLIFVMLKRRRA